MTAIRHDFPLKAFNTFGIDVKAKCFAEAASREEILDFLSHERSALPPPLLILGKGSNILFTGDYPGTVLKISTTGISILKEDEQHVYVSAEAGVDWQELVEYALSENLGGLENLSLIPGNVGSSPIQNIGAYGTEMKDCFHTLEAVEIESGKVMEFNAEECKFGYRTSVFKHELKSRFIILSVCFRLSRKPHINTGYEALREELKNMQIDHASVKDVAAAVNHIRRSKLPDPEKIGNAGSFFKNPEVSAFEYYRLKNEHPGIKAFNQYDGSYKLAAGWLIEQCGWKGHREGDAGVHEKQALILVNYGAATGAEIVKLAQQIMDSVHQKFGVELRPEVNIV